MSEQYTLEDMAELIRKGLQAVLPEPHPVSVSEEAVIIHDEDEGTGIFIQNHDHGWLTTHEYYPGFSAQRHVKFVGHSQSARHIAVRAILYFLQENIISAEIDRAGDKLEDQAATKEADFYLGSPPGRSWCDGPKPANAEGAHEGGNHGYCTR